MSNTFNAPRPIGNSFAGTSATANSGRVSTAEVGPIRASSSVLDVPITGAETGSVSSPGVPVYYGIAAGIPSTSADVKALSSTRATDHIDGFTVAPTTQYLVYAYPAIWDPAHYRFEDGQQPIATDSVQITIDGVSYRVDYSHFALTFTLQQIQIYT